MSFSSRLCWCHCEKKASTITKMNIMRFICYIPLKKINEHPMLILESWLIKQLVANLYLLASPLFHLKLSKHYFFCIKGVLPQTHLPHRNKMKKLGLDSKEKKVKGLELKQECVYQFKIEQPPLHQIEPATANRSCEAAVTRILPGFDTKSVAINCWFDLRRPTSVGSFGTIL